MEDYDPTKDLWDSVSYAYEVIRERKRNGGKGWIPSMSYQRKEKAAKMKDEYWKGWIDAIRNVDVALACRGDDLTIRKCRQDVLKLACVSCEPDHIVFLPVWPSDERLIELLSGPTGIPAVVKTEL